MFGLDGTEIYAGTVTGLDEEEVDVKASTTDTRYAVCVITAKQASDTATYEFTAELVLRTNMTDEPEANTV